MKTTRMPDDFALFIITHGRPDNVITAKTLKDCNYQGKLYIIIDDMDKRADEYKATFENVVVFNKAEYAKLTDQGDNFNNLRATLHARNACFDIARDFNLRHFMILEDDYLNFNFRFDDRLEYAPRQLRNLNPVLHALLKFYESTSVTSIAFAQGGDFMGGEGSQLGQHVMLKRKCMNSFLCSVDRPFKFISRLNDDVNTYIMRGIVGYIFFTMSQISLNQVLTQKAKGGMTEAYLESGTYVKSFYSVMYSPSNVKVKMMGRSNRRLHHAIKWKNTVPMILRESVKKA